jgi:hypothetical protein
MKDKGGEGTKTEEIKSLSKILYHLSLELKFRLKAKTH